MVFTNSRNLPAKSASEEKKHRKQYEAMVAEAKKKGRKLVLICHTKKTWRLISTLGENSYTIQVSRVNKFWLQSFKQLTLILLHLINNYAHMFWVTLKLFKIWCNWVEFNPSGCVKVWLNLLEVSRNMKFEIITYVYV